MDLYNEISFKTSKLITHKYSTSFSIAVVFLPNEMRQAIYSIYGFVRLANEIVDTFHSIYQKLMKKLNIELIKNIENDFNEAKEGIKELPGKSKLAVYIAYIY